MSEHIDDEYSDDEYMYADGTPIMVNAEGLFNLGELLRVAETALRSRVTGLLVLEVGVTDSRV